MGGVVGALARHADGVYAALDDADRARVRRVLTDLTRVARPTRRVWTRAEPSPARPSTRRTGRSSGRLTDERLLVSGRDARIGEETAEVAHEALVRYWPRLVGWLNEDRAFLLWRDRARGDLEDWTRDSTAVLRGPRLAEAERWLAERRTGLHPGLVDFIEQSRDARDAELKAKKDEQREREARLQQVATEQRRRAESEAAAAVRVRRHALVAAVLAVLGAATTVLAGSQWWRAEQQTALAIRQAEIAKTQEYFAKYQAVQARVSSIWGRIDFSDYDSYLSFEIDAFWSCPERQTKRRMHLST
jgi:hypothetical protein